MDTFNLKLFFIVNLFLNISTIFVNIDEVVEKNIQADAQIVRRLRDIGFIMCARECEARSYCRGFNFLKQHLLCEMLSEIITTKRFNDGWWHVDNTQWLQGKKLSIGMESKECNDTESKVRLSNGGEQCTEIDLPVDCQDSLIVQKNQTGGVYTISPQYNTRFDVFCDFEESGGPWTVIQARVDGSVDFDRVWADYKVGFGNLSTNFWLGNDNIHSLLSSAPYTLRVDIEYFDDQKYFAEYTTFYVAGEEDKYRLQINGYSGDTGNGLQDHNGQCFSTKDSDNDQYSLDNCASMRKGGWWFKACYTGYLNGKYYDKEILHGSEINTGIHWKLLRNAKYSMKKASMKVTKNIHNAK